VEPSFSEYLELDLATVVPSIAGPKRPQDRIQLNRSKAQFELDLNNYAAVDARPGRPRGGGVLPGIRPSRKHPGERAQRPPPRRTRATPRRPRIQAELRSSLSDGENFTIDHGAVTIAAITSCTNTSNPSVMLAAGLLARNAAKKGLKSKPWVKTTLAPGSKVVTEYYAKSGLDRDLEALGFYTVGLRLHDLHR
jgi:aconitate hydratase